MVSAVVQTSLFIAQWILILELLWITCIVIPFVILAITFRIFEWMLFDIIVNYLVSGSWQQNYNFVISATAPLMIMLYVALIFGFICGIVFYLTYATRNIFNPNGSEMIRKLFWIFSTILFILLIPFVFLILAVFMKFLSNLVISLFSKNQNYTNQLLPTKELLNNINYLNNLNLGILNEQSWNTIWNNITDNELLSLKNKIFTSYTKINNLLIQINFNILLQQINFNILNPEKIKTIFNNETLKTLNEISLEINNFYQLNQTLINNVNDQNLIHNINNLYANLMNNQNINNTIININNLYKNALIYKNIEIVDGKVNPTNNVGFVLYYAITGIYVNSVDGILNNLSFIPTLFQNNGILELGKSIAIGAIVAVSIYKGVFNFIIILVNRWFAILSLIPFGAICLTRYSNDNGDLFKIWIKEMITIFASFFVVTLNYQIFNFLISIITQGFINGNIQINDVGTSLTISIAFCIFVILILYSSTSFTNKILEQFTNSHTMQNQGMNQMVSEYNKNQSRIANRKSQGNNIKQPFVKKVSKMSKSFDKHGNPSNWISKGNVAFKNYFKSKFGAKRK